MPNQILQALRFGGLARAMRRDWDRRAREDALHFVNTGRRNWDERDFFATGADNVRDQILTDLEGICLGRDPARMRVLEIGCGVGRMTRALAEVFGEVHAVDVSPEMVARAQGYLRSVPNAHVYRNSGVDLRVLGELRFDFAYSFIVFQHIPSRAVIENYVREVSARLSNGSLFKFQVQGHLGPGPRRPRRNTWLGVGVSENEARRMAERNGFELRRATGAGTQYFWLWFYKR